MMKTVGCGGCGIVGFVCAGESLWEELLWNGCRYVNIVASYGVNSLGVKQLFICAGFFVYIHRPKHIQA